LTDNRPMSARDCGSCTACCEGWLVSTVTNMYPGHPCSHCTGQGCAIYASRPQDPCINFVCGWLQEDSPLPENMRPDQAGVIVLLGRSWQRWPIIDAIPTGQTIPEDSVEWLKSYAQEARIPLILRDYLKKGDKYVGQTTRGFGPPAFRDTVKYSIGPKDIVRM